MFRTLFLSASLLLAFAFILIQQGVVASSTWFLSQITAQSQSPSSLVPWMIGFLLALSLPYVPGVLAVRQLAHLKNSAQQKIIELLRSVIEGRATLLHHKEERERRFVFLQREGEDFITQACDAGFDFTQTLFNVALNIIALVTVVNTTLLPAYVLSLALLLVSVRLSKSSVSLATRNLQDARVNYDAVRLRTWENLTLGNTLNTVRWNASLTSTYSSFASTRLTLVTLREVSSLLSTWAAMLPVMAVNVWLIAHATSGAEIALLVATLPRQLMVLNHIHILSSYSGFWHELRERYAGLATALAAVDTTQRRTHDSRIRFSDVSLLDAKNMSTLNKTRAPAKMEDVESCINWTRSTHTGRFRVQGGNGAGKSTLLRSLKESLGSEAFYLPAENSALDFPVADGLSSGQRARSILEILRTSAPRILLLDEWDANLDGQHRASLNDLIEQLSERHLVLEVRHS